MADSESSNNVQTYPPETPVKGRKRFQDLSIPCESIEDYLPGGHHPVHLKDTLKAQYKVIRKLGYGGSSTVWLALDLKFQRYIALKIVVASKSDRASNEVAVHHYLMQSGPSTDGTPVTKLLDSFEHKGPNGVHLCLVFEAMGPSVESMLEEPRFHSSHNSGMNNWYPIWMARSILRQVLQGLVFLHEQGIVHGDLQPDNVLFGVRSLSSYTPAKLEQDVNDREGISQPVERIDGKVDLWSPSYLVEPRSLAPYSLVEPGFTVKLSDMGSAFFVTDPPERPFTPFDLRSPELILTHQFDKKLDIWSFGCLFFEIITRKPLFPLQPFSVGPDRRDDGHLLQMNDRLGPLPENLFATWSRSSLYFTRERVQINSFTGPIPEGSDPLSAQLPPLETIFDKSKPTDLSEPEAATITALIRRIMQYNPAERPTASQILQDEWFVSD